MDASRLPTWFTELSEDNAKAATVPTMHASVPSSPSSDAVPGQDAPADEDSPDRPFRRLLEHARRLGTGPAASDTSFKLYLHRIACGCGDANGGWPGAGAGFGEGSPFAGSFMGGGSSAFYPPTGGSGAVSFPLGGAGSSSLVGGPHAAGASGPASGAADDPSAGLLGGGGSARRALDDLSGDGLGLGLSAGDTGGEGVSASDAAGSGPWAWVDPLLQCIHTLEVWAVTILGSTDVRGATAAIGKAEDSSRRLHRKAKVTLPFPPNALQHQAASTQPRASICQRIPLCGELVAPAPVLAGMPRRSGWVNDACMHTYEGKRRCHVTGYGYGHHPAPLTQHLSLYPLQLGCHHVYANRITCCW